MKLSRIEIQNLSMRIDGLSAVNNIIAKLMIENAFLNEIINANEIDIKDIDNYKKARIIKKISKCLCFSIETILSICGMQSSSYHQALHQKTYLENRADDLNIIQTIYNRSKKKIGSPTLSAKIKDQYGLVINHKKVERIMQEANMKCMKKKGKKYSSYMGVGEITKEDLIGREFLADRPLQKIATDVMQLNYCFGKVYFQCYYDLFNREILAYDVSLNERDENTLNMLERLYKKYGDKLKGAIIHSDNGHQYTNKAYADKLKEYGIEQSLGRVGNCLDNSAYESFNKVFKEEIYEDKAKYITSFEQLCVQLEIEIPKYNNSNLRKCLGFKSPVQFRLEWEKKHNENK